MADILGIDRRGKAKESLEYQNLKRGIIPSETSRYQQIMGTYKQKNGSVSKYNCQKYKFFLDAPFEISDTCCRIMKKDPCHKFEKKTGRHPMLAQLASESRKRTTGWLKTGCNAFNAKRPQSNPMAFWTEQDILLYIKLNNIPICSVCGDIVAEGTTDTGVELSEDIEIFDKDRPLLKTTGCDRTGCMFCGYGCHLEDSPTRFERMEVTHPKQYNYIMKPVQEGGLGYKDVIDWINQHGNMNIKY